MTVPVVAGVDASAPITSGTTLSHTIPAGWSAGDLAIAHIYSLLRTVTAVPSGWTLITSITNGSVNHYTYQKKLVSGDLGASQAWTINAGSSSSRIVFYRVTGQHASSPIDASATAADGSNLTTHVSPSVTTTAADCLILRLLENGGQAITAGSGDTGTNVYSTLVTPGLEGWRSSKSAAGSTGTATYTTAAGRNLAYITIAIAPPLAAGVKTRREYDGGFKEKHTGGMMSRRKIKAGSTSQTISIFIQDTTSLVGGGLSGLVYNTASLAAAYRRKGSSTWTTIGLQTATLGSYTSGGFIANGSVAGTYEFGIPDTAIAAGAESVEFALYGAANMMPCLFDFELDTLNYQAAGGKVPATIAAGDMATDAITDVTVSAIAVQKIQAGLATASAMSSGFGTLGTKIDTANATLLIVQDDVLAIQQDVGLLPSAEDVRLEIDANSVKLDMAADLSIWFATMIELSGGAFRFTAEALAEAPAGGGGGGTTTIYVTPLQSTVPARRITYSGTYQAFRHCALPSGPIAIRDDQQAPIDLSGSDVKLVAAGVNDPSIGFTLTEGAGLSVGGDDDNQVTVDYVPAVYGEFRWWIFARPAGGTDAQWQVVAIGGWSIEDAPDPAAV